jgi:4-hydroxy-tetrahydrodipicolinate reductase
MAIRVFVSGVSGNVGRLVTGAVMDAADLELRGGWCLESGADLGILAGRGASGVTVAPNLRAGIEAADPEVIVDFTATPALKGNLETYRALRRDMVIGTTGLDDAERAALGERVVAEGLRWAVIPNYGLGIALVREFLRKARAFFPYATVTDRHPATMANAPSGTALMLAADLAEGPEGPVESREVLPGVLGGEAGPVRIHSERMAYPGPFSEHRIDLGRPDERISVTVTDFSSSVYLDGILLAVRRIRELPPGTFVTSLSDLT